MYDIGSQDCKTTDRATDVFTYHWVSVTFPGITFLSVGSSEMEKIAPLSFFPLDVIDPDPPYGTVYPLSRR